MIDAILSYVPSRIAKEEMPRRSTLEALRFPSVIAEYCDLPKVLRNHVHAFCKKCPGYLDGTGDGHLLSRLKFGNKGVTQNKDKIRLYQLVRTSRSASQVILLFDEYVQVGSDLPFNREYLRNGQSMSRQVLCSARRFFTADGGLDYLVQVASEVRPDVKERYC